MGWTFSYGTTSKALVREEILRDFTFATGNVIAHRTVGNHLWLAWERTLKESGKTVRCIVLCLLKKHLGEWGYKDMDESVGPYYYDCPLSLLEMIPTPPNEYAAKWRSKVREYHDHKKTRREQRQSGRGIS